MFFHPVLNKSSLLIWIFHMRNGMDKSNSRKVHAQIVGAALLTSSIRDLAKISPAFAKLLTNDGESLRQQFLTGPTGDAVSTGRILSFLGEAEVALIRGEPGDITTSFIETLITQMKNPDKQGAFIQDWMEKHGTFKERSIIMAITGGNVLLGVSGFFQGLQVDGQEAMNIAIENDKQANRASDAMAQSVLRIQKQFPNAPIGQTGTEGTR